MIEFVTSSWSLQTAIVIFVVCALAIGVTGTWLTGVADQLADRTGVGEAIAGAVLLGATTSLSGSVLSVTAALNNRPELAVGNALGGIAVQTAFLALADISYRQANLEHAAASAANMMQGSLLICMLSLLLLGAFSPDVTIFTVHPVTPILFAAYVYGITLVKGARTAPMWKPQATRETREDEPEEESVHGSLSRMVTQFLALAAIMGLAGWFLEKAAANIAESTGLTQTIVGLLMTSVSTSLPELVTSIAAVRRGALTLAVGGIIGGNAFDSLFCAFSDIAYSEGSIYHAISDQLVFMIALSMLMTGVLLMGLIRREKHGIGGIGFESFAVLVLYGFAVMLLLFTR